MSSKAACLPKQLGLCICLELEWHPIKYETNGTDLSEHSPNPDQPEKNGNYPIDINKVNAQQGIKWLQQAFKLFTSQMKSWLVIVGFLFILLLIPGINQIIGLLLPIPIAGIMLGCSQITAKTPLSFDHLFCALKTHTKPLIYLCAIYGLLSLVITFLTYMLMQFLGYDIINVLPDNLSGMSTNEMMQWIASAEGTEVTRVYLLTFLIYLVLLLPVMMAYWFAPPLIVLNNCSPINALKLSYRACKINLIPFTIYGLVGMLYILLTFSLISIISAIIPLLAIPLVLFFFLSVFAISIASIYTSYIQVFTTKNCLDKGEKKSSGSMIA